MIRSRLLVHATRGAGMALLSDGVVSLAAPTQRDQTWVAPRARWRRTARRVLGDAVITPGFAVAEIVVGIALVAVVPRVLTRH